MAASMRANLASLCCLDADRSWGGAKFRKLIMGLGCDVLNTSTRR